MNKLFQQLNANGGAVPEQARKMATLFKGARNPQAIIANAINSNPKVKPLIDLIKNGADPQALFYAKAQERVIGSFLLLSQPM